MILWQPAQVGTEACTLKRTRAVESPRALANSNLEKSTSPGGEGTVWHNMISRSALPRMVGELRPAGECKAAASKVTHSSGKSATYGQLAAAAAKLEPPKEVTLKDPKDWKIAGQPLKRLDTLPKVKGEMIYGTLKDKTQFKTFNPETDYTALIGSLQKAGVLLALDGLHPPSMGARVSFAGGTPKVTDGPFAEAKEVVGGYWMIQVKSREEAIEWAKRCPGSENETIEVRQVQEMSDFPDEIKEAAAGFEEMHKAALRK